jgi:ecdysone receptor
MLKIAQNQPTDGEDQSDLRFRHITEITILTVQLIVEFAKRLPGFDKLLREDQIALLKVRTQPLNRNEYQESSLE